MRLFKKIIIFLCAAAVVTTAVLLSPRYENTGGGNGGAVTNAVTLPPVGAGALSMEIDTLNLNVKVTKDGGGRVWESGARNEGDGFTDVWAKRVTDAFTVGYRDLNSGYFSERAITSLGSRVEISALGNGYSAKINLSNIGISFTASFTLADGGLTVEVPFSSITEAFDNYRLMHLIPFGYFDNSFGLADGFMLVPDGSGAVIDLSKKTDALQPYSQRVYGGDRGIAGINSRAYNVYSPQMPMFAMLYDGSGGFLAHIGSGAEYAEINACVPISQVNDNRYNYAFAKFIYREEYTRYFESAGSTGSSYVAFQSAANQFDLKITYLLLDETQSDLSAAANVYREYLLKKGILEKKPQPAKTGLMLQYLLYENKPSMFGSTVLEMTEPGFITANLDGLASFCPNLKIALSGYTKGGLSGSYPEHFPLEGGSSKYKKLLNAAADKGIEVSFVTDYVQAYDDSSGYSKKELAISISEQFIGVNGIPNSTSAMSYSGYNALTVNSTRTRLSGDLNDFNKLGAKSLVFNNMGGLLYSGFKNQSFSRVEQAAAYREMLSVAGVVRNIPLPNQYLWSVCDAFLDTPAASSGYIVESGSVPFLQMVISGYIPMYRKPVNLNYLGDIEALRMIDYNMYPSFLLTEKDAIELYGTQSAYIFTSKHGGWIDSVKDIYGRVATVLDNVAGEAFINRTEISPQIYVNEYANGARIFVNYTKNDFIFEGKTLRGESGGLL